MTTQSISPAREFMAELVKLTRPHRGWNGLRVRLGRDLCDCYVDVRRAGEDAVYLDQIAARPGRLGEGNGTAALELLCELADKHRVTIYGYATYNYELMGEDDDRLWRWYERHCFEITYGAWKHAGFTVNMFRAPMRSDLHKAIVRARNRLVLREYFDAIVGLRRDLDYSLENAKDLADWIRSSPNLTTEQLEDGWRDERIPASS